MKKLAVLALLSVLLTGCVSQADYDELEKENAKLKKKIEKLEDEISELESNQNSSKPIQNNSKTNDTETTTPSRFFTVENYFDQYTNDETGELITCSLYTDAQQNPMCIIDYSIPYKDNADISYYELKATWLVADMSSYLDEAGFENLTISISTPQGIDRDLQYSVLLNREFGANGKNRDGTDSDEPDWLLDTVEYLKQNSYYDDWLFDSLDEIHSNIDNCIHYH